MILLRRATFTLIEIVIAMALLLMIVGAVGVNVVRLVQQQRFQNDVNLVTDTLSRAQQLMLIYDQNVLVRFKILPDGISCVVETDCKLNPAWEKWVARHAVLLKHIHVIDFKDLNFGMSAQEEKQVRFSPKGGMLSRGILGMSTAKTLGQEDAFDAYICLPGYPRAIYSQIEPPKSCAEALDPVIASITKNEVMERMINNE